MGCPPQRSSTALSQAKNDVGGPIRRMLRRRAVLAGRAKASLNARQSLQHALSRWTIPNNLLHACSYILSGEVVLHELRDDFFLRNQVHHGKAGHLDPGLPQ